MKNRVTAKNSTEAHRTGRVAAVESTHIRSAALGPTRHARNVAVVLYTVARGSESLNKIALDLYFHCRGVSFKKKTHITVVKPAQNDVF